MKIVEKQGIRIVDFGALVQGVAAERIEIDWTEFCDYAEEHGADKAVGYLKNAIMPRVLTGGVVVFVLRNVIGKGVS